MGALTAAASGDIRAFHHHAHGLRGLVLFAKIGQLAGFP